MQLIPATNTLMQEPSCRHTLDESVVSWKGAQSSRLILAVISHIITCYMGDWILSQPEQYYFLLTQNREFQSLGLDRTVWYI
jgi:hypothetical protein